MLAFLVLTAVTFSLFGFIIGIWAKSFEQLQLVPLLIITPLTFLGGSFYSINMLPRLWRTVTLFNPVVYLISGFRWSFYGKSDVVGRNQPRHDRRLPARLPRDRGLDLPDRLPPAELIDLKRGASFWTRKGHCGTLILRVIPGENRSRFSGPCARGDPSVLDARGCCEGPWRHSARPARPLVHRRAAEPDQLVP